MDRRSFLRSGLQGTAIAACAGSGWYALVAQQARASPAVLRPPGAIGDVAFAAACVKCGRCVAACPYSTLKLADLDGPGAMGLPWFEPRTTACAMCADLPCVKACPTGALDPGLMDVAKARMGVAVIDAEHCLSWQGLRCEVCYRVCPVKGTAIRIDPHPRGISKHAVFVPVISADACTGCGLCENACPTEIAAVHVLRASLVQGRIGEHYRLYGKDGAAATIASPAETMPAREPAQVAPPTAPAQPAPGGAAAPGVDYLNRTDPP